MTTRLRAVALLGALAVGAAVLYAYRELLGRPFAADDYQWLLNVRGLRLGQLARNAFDPAAQTHFYRPLVWVLFWLQVRAFGLDPHGFHIISLGLHLLNAALAGWLAWRIVGRHIPKPAVGFQLGGALLAGAVVALHPAPFEAVVWISAQSELLAAALLLLALHCWLNRAPAPGAPPAGVTLWAVLATLALGLALLAKESAVIGLPLLLLFGWGTHTPGAARRGVWRELLPYTLPTLLTLAYIVLQIMVERRNYLLQAGGYGLGPQLLLNPLRSLALLLAPLTDTEHADNAWLVPLGALVAGLLLVALGWALWQRERGGRRRLALLLALGLTLAPTAPFASPPDSRYLYLPVIMGALWLAGMLGNAAQLRMLAVRRSVAVGAWLLVLGCAALAWWAGGELHLREWRFSAGAGPGGSLWQLATDVCVQSQPRQMLIVEPPLATPHAEAIVQLACGPNVRPVVLGRSQLDKAVGAHMVVISFPNGSATIERIT